jgi:hypothetical protein
MQIETLASVQRASFRPVALGRVRVPHRCYGHLMAASRRWGSQRALTGALSGAFFCERQSVSGCDSLLATPSGCRTEAS